MKAKVHLVPWNFLPSPSEIEAEVDRILSRAIKAPQLLIGMIWDLAAIIHKFTIAPSNTEPTDIPAKDIPAIIEKDKATGPSESLDKTVPKKASGKDTTKAKKVDGNMEGLDSAKPADASPKKKTKKNASGESLKEDKAKFSEDVAVNTEKQLNGTKGKEKKSSNTKKAKTVAAIDKNQTSPKEEDEEQTPKEETEQKINSKQKGNKSQNAKTDQVGSSPTKQKKASKVSFKEETQDESPKKAKKLSKDAKERDKSPEISDVEDEEEENGDVASPSQEQSAKERQKTPDDPAVCKSPLLQVLSVVIRILLTSKGNLSLIFSGYSSFILNNDHSQCTRSSDDTLNLNRSEAEGHS